MMNWKGFERKLLLPNPGTIPTVVWKGRGSPPKKHVRIDGVPVEIRTENLPDTSVIVRPTRSVSTLKEK
jgi:hypothetical protein